jgi:hypothetical protein
MGGGAKTRSAVEDSLAKWGLDYLDLVLLHAPDGGKRFRLDSWATLTELVQEGRIRSLGVSNFGAHHIKELLDSNPAVRPVCNQIECHPFFAQKELRAACERENIIVQAYCPLARGRYYGDKTLKKVADETGKTEAQVMLRWLIQHGIVALPKSSNPQRQVENADSLKFELSDEQMEGEQTKRCCIQSDCNADDGRRGSNRTGRTRSWRQGLGRDPVPEPALRLKAPEPCMTLECRCWSRMAKWSRAAEAPQTRKAELVRGFFLWM